jgi:hypothetical protein
MRYGSGVFARFEMSHFTEDATGDALAWSALTKSGVLIQHLSAHGDTKARDILYKSSVMIILIHKLYLGRSNIRVIL